MLKKTLFVLISLVFASLCDRAMAQTPAIVGGTQGSFVYVDGQSGSDSNPGSSSQPFKTIQAGVNTALANNRAGIPTIVSIAPGVYRETVTMIFSSTPAAITLEAAPGTVFIDGADVLTNGYQSGSSTWTFPWEDSVGGCPLPSGWYTGMPPIVRANEMVFLNGAPLTQVMSSSGLVPGTFYVNSPAAQVVVDPPSGTDMGSAEVEVSARRATLSADALQNVAFNGLIFQHAASCMNVASATIGSSSNVVVEGVQANWNNWGGLSINNSTGVTVEDSTASYNGGVGYSAFENTKSTYSNNETDYNNWRGETVGLYDYAQGGMKLMHTHSATVSGQRSYNNGAQGLWFDTDNMDVTVNNAELSGNLVGNLQLEANQGPITLENSSLCSGDVGVNLINSAGVTMTGNHFYNNGGPVINQNAQVFLSGKNGGRLVQNYETGSEINVFTSDTKMEDNSFTGVGAQQYVFDTYLAGNDWSEFINSVHSSNNDWFNAANANAFGLADGQYVDFTSWRNTANDTTSSWQLSSAAQGGCNVPAFAYPDFNLFAHNDASFISNYTMLGGVLSIPLQVKSFGFGTVNLSAPGLPTGVSASFSSSTLVSGNSILTLTAYSNATRQTIPVTIYAVSGSRVHTITLWVGIRPGLLSGSTLSNSHSAAISATPSSISISSPGATGSTTLAISNFTSNTVKFSCTGLPSGASCVFGALEGSGPSKTASLQITTSAPTTTATVAPIRSNKGSHPEYAFAFPGVIALFGLFTSRKRYAQWAKMVSLVVLVCSGLGMTACGVATGGGGDLVAQSASTPSGNSTVSVTAVSGSQTAKLTIALRVN